MNSKILIIEDNSIVAENLKILLNEEGFSVSCSVNGNEGILKAKSENPDLIICDILMPGINGYDVKKELNKYNKTLDIPFLFLTAKVDYNASLNGLNLCSGDYLLKPYKAEDLLKTVKEKIKDKELQPNW